MIVNASTFTDLDELPLSRGLFLMRLASPSIFVFTAHAKRCLRSSF